MAQMKETKAKDKSQAKPLEATLNKYGFVHFGKNLLADLGWTKGVKVTIEKNSDGSVTIRKVD